MLNGMRRAGVLCLVLFLTVVAVFGRLCFCEFTWYDDPATVHHNPSLNPPTLGKVALYWTNYGQNAPLGLYIPLTYTVWAGVAKLAYVELPDDSGIHLNPWLFHSVNVMLHALAAVGAFSILRRLVRHDWAAFVGALVFALHPVQVEAVGWVSGTKDVLAGLLSLLALWQYILFAQGRGWSHYLLGIVTFAAAMLAKPSAMVVPAVALIVDLLVLRRRPADVAAALVPWLVLVVPCMIWTRSAQPAADVPVAPYWARPFIALDALAFYLGKIVAPVWLTVDHGRTPLRVLHSGWWRWTWAVPAAAAALIFLFRRHRPVVAAGCIFVAGVLPVLGFVPFLFQRFSGVADHYLYLSMLGVALAAAVLLSENPGRLAFAVSAAVLLVLAVLTIRQTRVWRDDLTLWRHNVAINPQSGLAQLNLGAALFWAGDTQQAEHHYREAIRIDPDDAAAHENLARLLTTTGRQEQAIAHIRRVLEIHERLSPAQKAQLDSARLRLQQADEKLRGRP
jgi:hypothetical protein